MWQHNLGKVVDYVTDSSTVHHKKYQPWKIIKINQQLKILSQTNSVGFFVWLKAYVAPFYYTFLTFSSTNQL